jgi:hypothetical protein
MNGFTCLLVSAAADEHVLYVGNKQIVRLMLGLCTVHCAVALFLRHVFQNVRHICMNNSVGLNSSSRTALHVSADPSDLCVQAKAFPLTWLTDGRLRSTLGG